MCGSRGIPLASSPGAGVALNFDRQREPDVNSTLAIEAAGLMKHFGETRAVDGIDLVVPGGSVYGVLGPNGAGKTTTIRMLSTLLRPDAGTARVFGHDVVREAEIVRGQVSLTGQFASVDDGLTGHENLVLLARLLGYSRATAKKRASDLLAAFDLVDAGGRLAKTYSGGMRRRLDIAASIISAPKLIFLDEPTTGLDPRSRNQVWDTIRAVVARGATVLLTTQYLEEADQLADRIVVIDHGKVIAEGSPGELKASVGTGAVHVRLLEASQRVQAEQVLSRVLGVPAHPGADPTRLSMRTSDPGRAGEALSALASAGIGVVDFTLGQPSLDEVFLTLTGRPAEDTTAATKEAAK
nr:Arm27 [uncultured bacterium]